MSSQPDMRARPFFVILSGEPLAPGQAAEVGNKAWNLMRLASAGLPVPPAFVLPTSWCSERPAPAELDAAMVAGIGRLQHATGLQFGSDRNPLLVSVRSGAAVSMPGMMETVLDVGVNNETVQGLVRMTGNPRLAWDSYRRLIQAFAEVVQGLPTEPFDELVRTALAMAGAENERLLDHATLRQLVQAMLARFRELAGVPFPQSPAGQLACATEAVFRSWDAPKATEYRRLNHIDGAIGTAVTIQTMVFGNAGGTSGAGVGFTRDPSTGQNALYLDFQFNGQGEDVVAGRLAIGDADRLRLTLPAIWAQLETMRGTLETMFGDVQDFEFTVQDGRLFLLQTRNAKRTPWAALQIAVDLVEQGLVKPAEALRRLKDINLNTVGRHHLAEGQDDPLAHATVAGIGVVAGRIALTPEAARRTTEGGDPAILVRRETTTADILGMANAVGILTALGGRTSHAAVVARQLGRVCLVGCAPLTIDAPAHTCHFGPHSFNEGDWLTLDGNEGLVYQGRLKTVSERPDDALAIVRTWTATSPTAARTSSSPGASAPRIPQSAP